MKEYRIHKVLNNNIVQCIEVGKDEECMLLGKGIGFQKSRGDEIDVDKIEKVYFIRDTKRINQYLELVEKCGADLVETVEDVILQMEARFGNVYDEYLHIALLDHLNFSIYRYNNHIEVKNIFLEEFSVMYAEEYAFAKDMLAYINARLHMELPASEIGFITLHVHAALHKESVSKSALYMQIITACIDLIEADLKVHLDACSIERMRLITHLKFALERAEKHVELANPVLESLKQTYPHTYEIATAMHDMILHDFGLDLPQGEIGYLILHIQNIILTLEQQKEV